MVCRCHWAKSAYCTAKSGGRGSPPPGEGPIKRIQLVQHQPDGQSIRHDVMKVDDQDVFGFTELEQGDTNQRKARQVERFDRFFRGQGLQSVFAFLAGQVIQFRDSDLDCERGMDELQGFAVFDGERGSQYLVPLDDFIDTIFQRRHIQCALDAISDRQVVSRIAWRHPIDHPHLALGKRQGGAVTIWPFGYFRTSDPRVRSSL